MARAPKSSLLPQQEGALAALEVLTQAGQDLLNTLPPSAREPTKDQFQLAYNSLRNYVLGSTPNQLAAPASLANANAAPAEGVDPDTGF